MKKLTLVLAILLIAAIYVTPAMASDFSAGGTYRAEAVINDPGAGEDQQYFDQRMRVAFKWSVNDNVSAQLRGDFAEFQWGDGYRPEQGTDTLMIDRAFVTIKQGMATLTVGQQYGMFGLEGTLWGDQFQGIQAALDFSPVTLTLVYVKESEGGALGNTLTDDNANDDTDTYGVNIGYATDAFSGGLSYATTQNGATNSDLSGLGLYGSIPMGMFTINGELNTFFGDNGAGTDFAGTEMWLALDAKISDALQAGVTLLWADDVDANEIQAVTVVDDANFVVFDFDGALGYNNGNPYSCDIFDPSGNGNGVMGIIADAKFAATESLTLFAKLGYVEPNEDDLVLDSALLALANFDYAWMPAVTFSGGISYVDPDYKVNINDDAEITYTLQLGVSF